MIGIGEDLLKCDMAETYHLYITDWYNPPFPISYLADLAAGLSVNSRICRKMSGRRLTIDQTLQALVIDKLAGLMWQNTKDGHKGRRYPESILKKLEGKDEKKKDDLEKFRTVEEYEKWRKSKMR